MADDARGRAEDWSEAAIHEPEKRPKTAEDVREILMPFQGVGGSEVPDPEDMAKMIAARVVVGDPLTQGTDNGWAIIHLDGDESDAARLNLAMALAWTGCDLFATGDRDGAADYWDRALKLLEGEPLRDLDDVARQLRTVLRILPRV